MTLDEIKENADMAEKWPGAGVLNWGQVSFATLNAWVNKRARNDSATPT